MDVDKMKSINFVILGQKLSKKHIVCIPFLLFALSGCTTQPPNSAKIFSNAQVQYHTQKPASLARTNELLMPNYFFDIEYKSKQIALNKAQEQKMESVLKKLVYPEEYKLYISLGAGEHGLSENLTPMLKRAQYIKQKYAGKLKAIEIAYIKNQKPNSAYFRLIS